MSGHSEALVARVLALAQGASGASGLEVILAEPGRVHLAIDRRDDLVQFKGYFHGGVISGLADLAGGGAITTALPPGRAVITISLPGVSGWWRRAAWSRWEAPSASPVLKS